MLHLHLFFVPFFFFFPVLIVDYFNHARFDNDSFCYLDKEIMCLLARCLTIKLTYHLSVTNGYRRQLRLPCF